MNFVLFFLSHFFLFLYLWFCIYSRHIKLCKIHEEKVYKRAMNLVPKRKKSIFILSKHIHCIITATHMGQTHWQCHLSWNFKLKTLKMVQVRTSPLLSKKNKQRKWRQNASLKSERLSCQHRKGKNDNGGV